MRTFLVAILMVVALGVQAEQSTKQENLAELVQVMDMDAMLDSIYAQMEGMMQGMSEQMGVTPAEQPIFNDYYTKMTNVMRETMTWERMKPMVVDIYDRHFSDEEVAAMLDFYRTDAGQSILEKMPVITQESMQMSQVMMQEAIPKIQAIAQELAQDLEAARATSE